MRFQAVTEEWQIFKTWCSWRIEEKIDDVYIEYEDYIKIIRMMNALGLRGLAENFLKSKFGSQQDKTRELVGADKVEERYDEKAFVKAFIDNIESENIRNMFLLVAQKKKL